MSLTATFSRPVSGLAAGGITAGNCIVSNFAGSGAVYTFGLTPEDIGKVTVDMVAGAAEDASGTEDRQ